MYENGKSGKKRDVYSSFQAQKIKRDVMFTLIFSFKEKKKYPPMVHHLISMSTVKLIISSHSKCNYYTELTL
jgi:hypothetical protein